MNHKLPWDDPNRDIEADLRAGFALLPAEDQDYLRQYLPESWMVEPITNSDSNSRNDV